MPAKLSVALCTYNGEKYLGEQLASIAAQTRPPDELVICDDRSTDGTVDVVKRFAAQAPFRVRLEVNENNLGSTRNFERAIAMCEGELIALSDQDDVWLPEKLELLERQLDAPGVGLAFTDGELVDEELRPLGRRVWETIRFGEAEQRLLREGRIFEVLVDHNVVTGSAMCFRAAFRPLVLPLPTDIMHDGWRVIHDGWIALLVSAVADLAVVAEPLFKYRQHENQQLGVRGASVEQAAPPQSVQRVREAANRRNIFDSEIHYLRAIHDRLAANTEWTVRAGVLEYLSARLAHFETRSTLPPARLQRLAPVLRELFARRYHLYSKGLASAAKDLYQ